MRVLARAAGTSIHRKLVFRLIIVEQPVHIVFHLRSNFKVIASARRDYINPAYVLALCLCGARNVAASARGEAAMAPDLHTLTRSKWHSQNNDWKPSYTRYWRRNMKGCISLPRGLTALIKTP